MWEKRVFIFNYKPGAAPSGGGRGMAEGQNTALQTVPGGIPAQGFRPELRGTGMAGRPARGQ